MDAEEERLAAAAIRHQNEQITLYTYTLVAHTCERRVTARKWKNTVCFLSALQHFEKAHRELYLPWHAPWPVVCCLGVCFWKARHTTYISIMIHFGRCGPQFRR